MGLEEKRKAKEFQDTVVPKFVQDVKSTIGADVAVEIAWDTLTTVKAIESLETHVFEVTMGVLKEMGQDDMGKDALKGYLKKITVKGIPDYNNNNITTKDGALIFEEEFGGGSYVGDWKIKEELNKVL